MAMATCNERRESSCWYPFEILVCASQPIIFLSCEVHTAGIEFVSLHDVPDTAVGNGFIAFKLYEEPKEGPPTSSPAK
jgi:hypothetical protein